MQSEVDLIKIKPAGSEDAPLIRDLAYGTWFHAYSEILGLDQIRYMLNELYSLPVLSRLMATKAQQFIILCQNNAPRGFAAYGATSATVLKLHKIYVLPNSQGLGYGKMLINYVVEQALTEDFNFLELNVNRYNKALVFYEKLGFSKVREVDIPIGPYWMNDFIMSLDLSQYNGKQGI